VKKYMANLGNSNQIIVGAARLFVSKGTGGKGALKYSQGSGSAAVYNFGGSGSVSGIPAFAAGTEYGTTMEAATDYNNVGYTSNGLELQFQPDFGEVQVDQLLDVAKLYKQGMQVNLVTAFAEATLENLLLSIAAPSTDKYIGATATTLDLNSGELGSVPVERALIAVGPGSGDPDAVGASAVERVYVAHRALSIDNVTVMAKRDAPSMFEVTFRLLPASNGSYGKIVDRVRGA
jgi:hypothetical protein